MKHSFAIKATTIVLAVAGSAFHAAAAVNTRMEFQVSPAGQESWTSTINAVPGQSIDIRVRVSYIGTAAPIGLGSINFQPTVSNWDSTGALRDAFGPFAIGQGDGIPNPTPPGFVVDAPGQYGRIRGFARATNSPAGVGPTTGHITQFNGTNYLRIAAGNATSWQSGSSLPTGSGGVDTSQWTPGFRPPTALPFDTRLADIVLVKFNITLSGDAAARIMLADAPQELIGLYNAATGERQARWVANELEPSGSIAGAIQTSAATINVIPAPGAVGVLMFGGLLASRRRR